MSREEEITYEAIDRLIERFCEDHASIRPSKKSEFKYVFGRMCAVGLVDNADVNFYLRVRFGR